MRYSNTSAVSCTKLVRPCLRSIGSISGGFQSTNSFRLMTRPFEFSLRVCSCAYGLGDIMTAQIAHTFFPQGEPSIEVNFTSDIPKDFFICCKKTRYDE